MHDLVGLILESAALKEDATQVDFFRCPVQPEQANAKLKCGHRFLPVILRESSIDGFTVMVEQKYSSRLRMGRDWKLFTEGERSVVHGEWIFVAQEGMLQVGLRRIEDITPAEKPQKSGISGLFSGGFLTSRSSPGLVLGGLLIFVFASLSTQPIGGRIGTAQPIRRIVLEVYGMIRGFF